MGCTGNQVPVCNSQCRLNYTTCFVGENHTPFQLDLTTYLKTWRPTWKISNREEIVWEPEDPYRKADSLLEFRCMDIGCYNLTLSDMGNDGICCTEINNETYGHVSVFIDGTPVENNTDPNFGALIVYEIGTYIAASTSTIHS